MRNLRDITLLIVLLPTLAAAQASDTDIRELKLWHRDRPAPTVEGNGRPRAPIATDEHFFVKKRGRLSVVVLDANPYLFTYAFTKGASTPSPNQQAADGFFKAAASLINLLPKADTKASPPNLRLDDLDVEDFYKAIEEVEKHVGNLPNLIDASLEVQGPSTEVYLEKAQAFRERLKDWPALLNRIEKHQSTLKSLARKCVTNPSANVRIPNSVDLTCETPSVRDTWMPLDRYQDDLQPQVDVLKAFQQDAQHLRPVRSESLPFELADSSLSLEVKASTKYAAFSSEAAKAAQANSSNTTVMALRAYSAWTLSAGPAFVYSFVKNPTFSTVFEGGRFRVATKTEEVSAYSVGAMLDLQPRALEDATVSVSWQIGITPVKDQVGVLTGLAVSLLDKLTFGGGLIRQQIRRLADGVGEVLDSPDQLKTSTRWTTGAYLTLTYKP